jgi:hypothetical protein
MTKMIKCPRCKAVIKASRYAGHAKERCPAIRTRRPLPERRAKRVQREPSVEEQQRAAARLGKRWLKCTCTECGAAALVHVDWIAPLVMCKNCRRKREARFLSEEASDNVARAYHPRMPTAGRRVGGGLPSLGRRR